MPRAACRVPRAACRHACRVPQKVPALPRRIRPCARRAAEHAPTWPSREPGMMRQSTRMALERNISFSVRLMSCARMQEVSGKRCAQTACARELSASLPVSPPRCRDEVWM